MKIKWPGSPLPAILALCLASQVGDAAPAGDEDAARRAKVIAKVGDATITVGDVEDRLGKHMRPELFEDRQKLEDLVDAMVDRELLVHEAKKRKLDESPRVQNHLKRILYNQVQTRYVMEQLPIESITMDEVRAYYDEHSDEYNQPTLVRAYHIRLADEQAAKNVLAQVKQEGMDLRKFKVLAGEKSEDETTRKRGGDLRYFNQEGEVWTAEEKVPAPVVEAAFSVKVLVRASVAVTQDQDEARRILEEAMKPGLGDGDFKKIVAAHPGDPEAGHPSGDIGFFNLEGLVEEGGEEGGVVPWDITRAAFSMREPGHTYPKVIGVDGWYHVVRVTDRRDPGNLYPEVVQSDEGWHVLWVVNRRPAVHKTVEEMEPSIRQRLWQEKKKEFMKSFIEDLRKKYDVKIHEEKLAQVEIDLGSASRGGSKLSTPPGPAVQPPALPGK